VTDLAGRSLGGLTYRISDSRRCDVRCCRTTPGARPSVWRGRWQESLPSHAGGSPRSGGRCCRTTPGARPSVWRGRWQESLPSHAGGSPRSGGRCCRTTPGSRCSPSSEWVRAASADTSRRRRRVRRQGKARWRSAESFSSIPPYFWVM